MADICSIEFITTKNKLDIFMLSHFIIFAILNFLLFDGIHEIIDYGYSQNVDRHNIILEISQQSYPKDFWYWKVFSGRFHIYYWRSDLLCWRLTVSKTLEWQVPNLVYSFYGSELNLLRNSVILIIFFLSSCSYFNGLLVCNGLVQTISTLATHRHLHVGSFGHDTFFCVCSVLVTQPRSLYVCPSLHSSKVWQFLIHFQTN